MQLGQHSTLKFFPSEVTFEDTSVTTATDQSITCTVTGLSQDTPVTWMDPDNNQISDSDTVNYVIDQGTYILGNKASTLTIKTAKLAALSFGSQFICKVKSSLYPLNSPEVSKEMILTLLTFGMPELDIE